MVALYARLMRLYPETFRARFADEMLLTLRDEIRFGGRVPWVRRFADLFGSALVQRGRDGKMRTKLAVIAFIVLAVGGGTFVVTGAASSVSGGAFALGIIALLAILYGIAALLARRGALGAEHDYAARTFRWWWVPAGLIGAFQLLFMTGQLIDDPKIENVFALAVVAAFSALVFGGMAVRNRRAGNWMIATGVLPMVPFIWVVVPPLVSLLVIVMAMSDNIRMTRAQPAV
jgi:hypothetical protein